MLENANAYMCDDMRDTVILINKFLASGSSKKLREKLKNPPPYKPKRKRAAVLCRSLWAQAVRCRSSNRSLNLIKQKRHSWKNLRKEGSSI